VNDRSRAGNGPGGPDGPGGPGPTSSGTSGPSRERAAFDPQLCGVGGPLETLTFEELLAALELVASRLAGGELGIEAAVDLYEQAELLHAAAQERLAAVEARVERLGPAKPDLGQGQT
jgi:exodeoxyribonuclease VII small subunit